MKKLALFAMLCVSVIGFSVGCSGEGGGTEAPEAPATEGNGDAAAPAAEGSDTSETPEAPAE